MMPPELSDPYQARIDDLREFEFEYRARLCAFLEKQLAELDPDGACSLRSAALRLAAAPDGDLAGAVTELTEQQRSRLLSVLLRVPVTEATP